MISRHGIPHAGNFMSTESILITGAVDAMGVDVQCIKQGLGKVADCYGTRLFTITRPIAWTIIRPAAAGGKQ